MSNNYGANLYKETAIKTANRGQLLIMLYEAAIRNVKKAIEGIENNDLQAKGVGIGRCHDILNELLNTLNFEVGGDIAKDLERLYNYMTENLVKANLENNKDHLKIIQKLLETLLDGWRQAVEKVNRENAK